MQALFRNILCSGIIFSTSQFSVFSATLQEDLIEPSGPRFSVEHLTEYHPRFNGLLSLSLVNASRNSLSNYRIVAMVKKNIHEPFTPGNVTEHLWSFIAESDEVVLPLLNLGFTLVIYRGDFDDVRSDRDVIDNDNSEQVFMLDGEEINQSIQSLRLIVH